MCRRTISTEAREQYNKSKFKETMSRLDEAKRNLKAAKVLVLLKGLTFQREPFSSTRFVSEMGDLQIVRERMFPERKNSTMYNYNVFCRGKLYAWFRETTFSDGAQNMAFMIDKDFVYKGFRKTLKEYAK